MRKFILNIVFFTCILAVINAVLYLFNEKLYIGDYQEYSMSFKTYLLADSHGLPLQNVTEKYNVYNFSSESESYFDMERKMHFLVKNTQVDTVYITVDDHTLSPYREKVNNLDRSLIYATSEDFDNYYTFIKEKYIAYYLVLFQPKARTILKSYAIAQVMKIFNKAQSNAPALETNNWMDLNDNNQQDKAEVRFTSQFSEEKPSKALEESLINIITICEEHDITLIGIKFPLTSIYSDLLANKTYGAEEILTSRGVPILDYKNVFQNKNELFLDQDHLNDKGGSKFVELVFNKE